MDTSLYASIGCLINAKFIFLSIEILLENLIFNGEEKQIFSVSFKGYLKHDPNLDFVIDLDSVWKLIGYSEKGVAKRALLKSECLEENVDYIIQNFALQNCQAKTITGYSIREEEEKRGGRNREIILMTINTFKKFCMMAGTKQAYKMHDYYIKLEQCVHEVNQTELIQLDSEFTLGKLYKVVCKIKDSIDNIEIIKNLNIRNNELKNIIKELVD